MSVIDVRRERDIVLIPSLSDGTAKEGDGKPGSPPEDLEGKTSIDCGRDRGGVWVLDDEDGRDVWLTILDATALDVSFRSGSTVGGMNFDEVGGLSVEKSGKDGPDGDEDLGRPAIPFEVSNPERRMEDLLVSDSDLCFLSLSKRFDPPHKSTRSCTELCRRFGFEPTSAFFCPLLLNSLRVPNPPSGSSGPSSLLTDPKDGFRGS